MDVKEGVRPFKLKFMRFSRRNRVVDKKKEENTTLIGLGNRAYFLFLLPKNFVNSLKIRRFLAKIDSFWVETLLICMLLANHWSVAPEKQLYCPKQIRTLHFADITVAVNQYAVTIVDADDIYIVFFFVNTAYFFKMVQS